MYRDFSVDVFSAGVILTEILLGAKLWKNKSDLEIIKVREIIKLNLIG